MKKSYTLAGIGGGVAVAIALSIALFTYSGESADTVVPAVSEKSDDAPVVKGPFDLDFTYEEANSDLKEVLKSHKISMSSPIKLQLQSDVVKYCSFFSDEKQQLVEYCTSTELRDSDGNFLGNIHMVGSPVYPRLVIVLVQADPVMSQLDEVKTVFSAVIENTVCDCWEQLKPDGFATVGMWIDGLREFHSGGTEPHSQSKTITIEDMKMQIELTTNTEGYLWELLVGK